MRLRRVLKRIALFNYLLLCLLLVGPMTVSALTQDDLNSVLNGTPFYDPNDLGCGNQSSTTSVPAGSLPAFIPEPYNGAFTQGANNNKVAPSLVAAIFSEEHALGGDTHGPSTANLPAAWANFIKNHPDPNSGWASSDKGAQGPFQFIPDTWIGQGQDIKDINNLVIAADTAAKYLASNGGTVDHPENSWKTAIYDYNHADWYVNAVLTYYDYYNSQPAVTPSDGSTVVTNTDSTSGCASACATSQIPADGKPTIVIDPGHAGTSTAQVDPASGLETIENGGAPGEMQNMWDTAQIIKAKLEADGYNVVLTKNSEDDSAGFVTKVGRANAANPALAVSLHYTGDWAFNAPNDHFGVSPQEVGLFRQNKDNGKKLTFTDAAIAQQSQQDAQIMASERTKAGDSTKVAILDQSFPKDRPDVQAFGNIPVIQLMAKVPWVYNETGANGFDKQKYAFGITNGIEKAVPTKATPGSAAQAPASCGVVAGDIVQTAVGLSWPDDTHGRTPSPAYAQALEQFNPTGFTATNGRGDDCGVFVATVMHASGADPNYPASGTIAQANYVISHSNKYQVIYPATQTGQLQPGDILIINENTSRDASGNLTVLGGGGAAGGHTYIYVGPQAPSGYNAASASYQSRSANLGGAFLTDNRGQFMIARLK